MVLSVPRFSSDMHLGYCQYGDGAACWARRHPDDPSVRNSFRGAMKDPLIRALAKAAEGGFCEYMGFDPAACLNFEPDVRDEGNIDVYYIDAEGRLRTVNVKHSQTGKYLITSLQRREHLTKGDGPELFVLVRVTGTNKGNDWVWDCVGWISSAEFARRHRIKVEGDGTPRGIVPGTPYMLAAELRPMVELRLGGEIGLPYWEMVQ